jgi:hypothetical protein
MVFFCVDEGHWSLAISRRGGTTLVASMKRIMDVFQKSRSDHGRLVHPRYGDTTEIVRH